MGEDENTGTVPYKKMFLISVTAAFFIGCYDGFYGPGTGTFLLLVFTGAAKWIPAAHPHRRRSFNSFI